MASITTQLFQDEHTQKGRIGGTIKRVLVGTLVGVTQSVVESNDRAILGMKMSTLAPAVITVGSILTTMISKNAKIRSIASDATVAGSVILGQKYIAPRVTTLLGRTLSMGRTLRRGGGGGGQHIAPASTFGYVNKSLYW